MTDPLFSRNSQRLRDHRHPKVSSSRCRQEGASGGGMSGVVTVYGSIRRCCCYWPLLAHLPLL